MNRISYILLFAILTSLFACSDSTKKESQKQKKDFCSSIHRNDSLTLSGELASFSDSMKNKTGVYVLEDGGGSMVARAWLCEYSEKTIDIQYFIFSADNVGLIACDYLVRAADRGIKVRILVDDIMVNAEINEILTLDSHKNISIKIYNPGVNLGKNIFSKIKKYASDFRSANQRMHNKTFTVDGKVVITGGRNIADEYFDYDHDYNFRDRDVLLLGKVTSDVQKTFNDFWDNPLSVPVTRLADEPQNNFNDSNKFEKLHQYACNPENFWPQVRDKIKNLPDAFKQIQQSGELVWLDSVSFVSDIPGKNDGTKGLAGGGVCTDALIKLVKEAKYSLEIQSPYLITSELSQGLFRDAVKRGVKVRILTTNFLMRSMMRRSKRRKHRIV